MSQVFDFKSINAKLNRLEQKADFEEKNPKPVELTAAQIPPYGWPYVAGADSGDVYTPAEFNEFARMLLAEHYGKFKI